MASKLVIIPFVCFYVCLFLFLVWMRRKRNLGFRKPLGIVITTILGVVNFFCMIGRTSRGGYQLFLKAYSIFGPLAITFSQDGKAIPVGLRSYFYENYFELSRYVNHGIPVILICVWAVLLLTSPGKKEN